MCSQKDLFVFGFDCVKVVKVLKLTPIPLKIKRFKYRLEKNCVHATGVTCVCEPGIRGNCMMNENRLSVEKKSQVFSRVI